MVNQKYTSTSIAALRCTILTNTKLTFWKLMLKLKIITAWKVPMFGGYSGSHFSAFRLNIERCFISQYSIWMQENVDRNNSEYENFLCSEQYQEFYQVNNDDRFTKKMDMPQGKFIDLVSLFLITTWCTSDSQFYEQTDDVAMGGPALLTTVEIYMHAHERTAISTALHPLKVW